MLGPNIINQISSRYILNYITPNNFSLLTYYFSNILIFENLFKILEQVSESIKYVISTDSTFPKNFSIANYMSKINFRNYLYVKIYFRNYSFIVSFHSILYISRKFSRHTTKYGPELLKYSYFFKWALPTLLRFFLASSSEQETISELSPVETLPNLGEILFASAFSLDVRF